LNIYERWGAALFRPSSKRQLITYTLILNHYNYRFHISTTLPLNHQHEVHHRRRRYLHGRHLLRPSPGLFSLPSPRGRRRLPSDVSTAVQYGDVQAKEGSLVINSPDQNNKTCVVNGDRDNTTSGINYASFSLDQESGSVYIYTFNPPLQLYVDRSGMGMGNVRYSTGVQPIGKNQERGPFKINDDGDLVFAAGGLTGDVGFQACPGAVGGGWKIWLSGVDKPAGSEGCTPFTMKALKEAVPKKCLYSSAPA
jgi:hypothetical protein